MPYVSVGEHNEENWQGSRMGPYDDGDRELPVLPISDADTVPCDTRSKSASYIVDRLLALGVNLTSVRSVAGNGPAADLIAAATDEVFQLIRDIQATPFGSAADQAAEARKRLAEAARELQARALDTAELLERRAGLIRQPSAMDYPAEIKRWRAFAAQAELMAQRWEQRPCPDADEPYR